MWRLTSSSTATHGVELGALDACLPVELDVDGE
jgi:hypothetical protein